MSDELPLLQPRDILSPSATLLGFIITALGIVLSLGGDQPNFIKNVFLILLFTIIFIVLSAMLTIFSSIRQNRSAWWWARTVYGTSWLFLGLIVIIILIGMVYGVKSLQIQLPDFNTNVVSAIAAISGVTSALVSYFRLKRYENDLEKSISNLAVDTFQDKMLIGKLIENVIAEQEFDREMAFTRIYIEIESLLRKILVLIPNGESLVGMYPRKIIDELLKLGLVKYSLKDSFSVINKVRNTVVHGGTVNKKELDMAIELAASLFMEFERLENNLRIQRSNVNI